MPPPDPPEPPEPPEPPDPPELEPLPEPPPELADVPVLHAVRKSEHATIKAHVGDFQGKQNGGDMTFYFFAETRMREEDLSSYFVARGHVLA